MKPAKKVNETISTPRLPASTWTTDLVSEGDETVHKGTDIRRPRAVIFSSLFEYLPSSSDS